MKNSRKIKQQTGEQLFRESLHLDKEKIENNRSLRIDKCGSSYSIVEYRTNQQQKMYRKIEKRSQTTVQIEARARDQIRMILSQYCIECG